MKSREVRDEMLKHLRACDLKLSLSLSEPCSEERSLGRTSALLCGNLEALEACGLLEYLPTNHQPEAFLNQASTVEYQWA